MNIPLLDVGPDEMMIDLELAMEDEEETLIRVLGKRENINVDLIQFELNGELICWIARMDPIAKLLDLRGIEPIAEIGPGCIYGDLVIHYRADVDAIIDEIKNL